MPIAVDEDNGLDTANEVKGRKRASKKKALVVAESKEVTKRELVAPRGISKSLARSLGCETYFTGVYLQPGARPENEHPLAKTGSQFHAWRADYIDHLVDAGLPSDPSWAETWLGAHPVGEDARVLILRDAMKFAVDPETVYGTELFLSISRNFEPLEHEFGRQPGKLSEHPDFLLSGQLDLVLISGDVATIIDPKSGFSTVGVTDDEPPFYALLVMTHFPTVNEVRFHWDFVRVQAAKRASYTRADLEWIKARVLEVNAKKDDIVRRANQGKTLAANPFSGLCPYCSVTCPLRPRADAGELAIAPPQTRQDAIRIAQFLAVCESGANQARLLLRGWLDQELFGALDLGGDWVASVSVNQRNTYPLVPALNAMGLDVIDLDLCSDEIKRSIEDARPRYTPWYDVPLESLALSGVSGFAKTSRSRKRAGGGGGVSREGMREALDAIAKPGAATVVSIRKVSQSDEIVALEAADERRTG